MPASNPSNDPFVKITMGMFDMIERYRKENAALKEMLLTRGLTKRQLQKEMNALLKHPKPLPDADLQFRELREEMKVVLERNQGNLALLAGMHVSGKPQ
jgi:hypothetical protein